MVTYEFVFFFLEGGKLKNQMKDVDDDLKDI